MGGGETEKETWTNNFVYVSEVSANTYAPYTSKSPRRSVSIRLLLLVPHLICRFSETRIES